MTCKDMQYSMYWICTGCNIINFHYMETASYYMLLNLLHGSPAVLVHYMFYYINLCHVMKHVIWCNVHVIHVKVITWPLHAAIFYYRTCNGHVMACNDHVITCITWVLIPLQPYYTQAGCNACIYMNYMTITCRARC